MMEMFEMVVRDLACSGSSSGQEKTRSSKATETVQAKRVEEQSSTWWDGIS